MKQKLWNTDQVMKTTWFNLMEDLKVKELLNEPPKNWREARTYSWPSAFKLDAYSFKKLRQAESFIKRYHFNDDLYTDQELSKKSFEKFLATQIAVGSFKMPTDPGMCLLLRKTRALLKSILGSYCMEEHNLLCKFGIRATVGSPLQKGQLDLRLSQPISSSAGHVGWFERSYLKDDVLLAEIVNEIKSRSPLAQQSAYEIHDCLPLQFVPKSYKIKRSICPNTTIGTLYTSGLGLMIRDRLRNVGINIESAQEKHAYLAYVNSKTKNLCTLDLSAASDSFTPQLLRRLLPKDWWNALNLGRIRYFSYNNKRYPLSSFMTMGIGFTFELQTLVFYSLVRVMCELHGTYRNNVFCYGDDIIAPTKSALLISRCLSKLGFVLNLDKSFYWGDFRESCGADFFRGIDVRPFQPEGVSVKLTKNKMLAFVHNLINGFLRRWSPEELETTLSWLYTFLQLLSDEILYVPTSFPETSGVKFKLPGFNYKPWEWSWGEGSSFNQKVYYLSARPEYRRVTKFLPFYWDSLRLISQRTAEWQGVSTPSILWREERNKSLYSHLHRCRMKKLYAVVAVHKFNYELRQTLALSEAA